MNHSENTNIYSDDRNLEGRRCLIWVGRCSIDDPEEPFEAVVKSTEREGGLLLVGDSVPYLVVHHESPYSEFLLKRGDDYLAQGCYVVASRPLGPPKLTKPPELPTYYYWQPRRGGGGHWQLTLWCPDCETVHLHGGGSGETPSLGHRIEHCPPGGAYADTGYNLADPKLIQGVCDNGHSYLPDNILITADGLQCGKCEKARIRAAKRAANPNLKQYRTGTVSD